MCNEFVDEFTMEQKTRHRLTGTLFLVSASYIFITLLMGESGSQRVDVRDLDIDVGDIPAIPSFCLLYTSDAADE